MQYHLEFNVVGPGPPGRSTKRAQGRRSSAAPQRRSSLAQGIDGGEQHGSGPVQSQQTDAITAMAEESRRKTTAGCSTRRSSSQPHLLAQTHPAGHRVRERWLMEVADRSAEERWSKDKAEAEVRKAAARAVFAQRIKTQGAHSVLVSEGLLATCPEVRSHIPRLIRIRDDAWATDSALLRETMHNPSHTLVDMMRRQRRPDQMKQVASLESYLASLRHRFLRS